MVVTPRTVRLLCTAALSLTVSVVMKGQQPQPQPAAASGPSRAVAMAAHQPGSIDPQATLKSYCVTCHNDRAKTGGLSLDGVDVSRIADHPELGEKIVRKLRAGLMPPAGMPRPDATATEALTSSLEQQLDQAALTNPRPTAPGAHRLNRREYANAIRELLALDIDPATLLPVDDSSYGFDNMAGTLGTSPALIEAYVSAASKISRLALGHEMTTVMKTYLAPADYSQNDHQAGQPFGTRGGLVVQHYFPVDGFYEIDWTPVRANAGGLFGNTTGEQLEMTLDGQRLKVYDVDKEVPRGGGTAADNHPVRVSVTAGLHNVGVSFLASTHVPSEDMNRHFERTTLTQNVPGFTFSMHVNSLQITGPFEGKRPDRTASRDRIFVCRPTSVAEETACARRVLSTLAAKAFRRNVTDSDVRTLMAFYDAGRKEGAFDDGIERGVQLILSDPEFIYRTEGSSGPRARTGQIYPLTDVELASRLSFFLWSAPPDDALLAMARQGKLKANLESQVRRMLADPRSKELVRNFAGQWLLLRNLQATAPVADLFPDFDDNLRQAFRTETEMFFESIMREDRSVVDLLNADYTFVNDRLARHYGIPNVYGSQFRRVTLGPELDYRRGLLGQGSILMVTSFADRTAPVKRGKWVVQNILGVVPPEPPPNIPVLKEVDQTAHAKVQSMRQRMEAHRQPACASCHRMMDPIGFAMENFDAVGAYRTTERSGQRLDLTGELVDGSRFTGSAELRKALLRYSPRFVQAMTENLLTYALGRGVEHYDMPVVRHIVKDAAAHDNRFSSLVLGIVASAPFQMSARVDESVTSTAQR